jgi:hypothetical protein
MRNKHKIALAIYLFILTLLGCTNPKDKIERLDCKEIEKYPSLFSYINDSLKNILWSKGIKPLTKTEKEIYFKKDDQLNKVYDSAFNVFPVNKILYSKSAVAIYLVKEIGNPSSPYDDELILVIYTNDGIPKNFLIENLQDPFGTREINFTSRDEFEVTDTDDEYSTDPESEAEDIKNGREPETSIMTSRYEIDTLALKFRLIE